MQDRYKMVMLSVMRLALNLKAFLSSFLGALNYHKNHPVGIGYRFHISAPVL